jgi:hypothetical protein
MGPFGFKMKKYKLLKFAKTSSLHPKEKKYLCSRCRVVLSEKYKRRGLHKETRSSEAYFSENILFCRENCSDKVSIITYFHYPFCVPEEIFTAEYKKELHLLGIHPEEKKLTVSKWDFLDLT